VHQLDFNKEIFISRMNGANIKIINMIIEFGPNCLQHVSGDGFSGGSPPS